MDGLAFVGIGILVADQHAIFVVLIGGNYVHISWGAWKSTRRDTALGDLIALIPAVDGRYIAIEPDDFSALNRDVKV